MAHHHCQLQIFFGYGGGTPGISFSIGSEVNEYGQYLDK
jgi:hypothetical protein